MSRILIFLLFFFSIDVFGQTFSGIITDEYQNPLAAVLVFNLQTEQKVDTNLKGEFTINASIGNELRFIRAGFERSSKIIQQQNFNNPFVISIVRTIAEIEEVKVSNKPTGNLTKDAKNVGDRKAVLALKNETSRYIRSKSSDNVLSPKQGEFVQPVGKGFTIGEPNNKWDDIDFMNYLIENIQMTFFIDTLKLKSTEIQPFINYIFKNFERKKILFYGNCSQYDLSRFIAESDNKIDRYKKNLPNNPQLIKKKRR